MNISELSLKRPVLATVMNLTIILFGIVGFSFLSLRDYPAIDPPIITVRTNYTGANADIIESQITEPLEKGINGIPGIRSISSSSQVGSSNITVEFNLGIDLDDAANDVRDKVSQAQRNLPQDIDSPPVVSKSEASNDFIIILAVQSRSKDLMELSDYAENVLLQRFQTIDQVSAINIFGQKRYAMRIWIKPDAMSARNIAFTDISNALAKENVELPAGKSLWRCHRTHDPHDGAAQYGATVCRPDHQGKSGWNRAAQRHRQSRNRSRNSGAILETERREWRWACRGAAAGSQLRGHRR
jgi:multidrug efflux pump subunit AcrB